MAKFRILLMFFLGLLEKGENACALFDLHKIYLKSSHNIAKIFGEIPKIFV